MGVLKNDVGRPSNKTIIIRNILKAVLIIILAAMSFLLGNLLTEKKSKDKVEKTEMNNVVNVGENQQEQKKLFDERQITTRRVSQAEDGIYIYSYGKKLELDMPVYRLGNVEVIEDIAIMEVFAIDAPTLIIVNMDGEILYDSAGKQEGVLCDASKSNECYGFNIISNKITYYMDNFGHDISTVCDANNQNDAALIEYELTYENGKLSSPKKINSLTGKEYVNKHNIDCSVVK